MLHIIVIEFHIQLASMGYNQSAVQFAQSALSNMVGGESCTTNQPANHFSNLNVLHG